MTSLIDTGAASYSGWTNQQKDALVYLTRNFTDSDLSAYAFRQTIAEGVVYEKGRLFEGPKKLATTMFETIKQHITKG